MVELRKRKTPPPAPAPSAKKAKSSGGAASKLAKAKAAITKTLKGGKSSSKANGEAGAAAAAGPPAVGDILNLEGFGGEAETHDGSPVNLKKLVDESKEGVVLFTYPKASTPGCTTQACLFRDSYTSLTSTGLSIYGLSNDSPKANSSFKTKQNLPYPLICNPSGSLISAIGLGKSGGKTTRGVFVVDKQGKVLAAEPGGPAATLAVVKRLVDEKGTATGETAPAAGVSAEKNESALAPVPDATVEEAALEKKQTDDKEKADVADEVADTAAKLDG